MLEYDKYGELPSAGQSRSAPGHTTRLNRDSITDVAPLGSPVYSLEKTACGPFSRLSMRDRRHRVANRGRNMEWLRGNATALNDLWREGNTRIRCLMTLRCAWPKAGVAEHFRDREEDSADGRADAWRRCAAQAMRCYLAHTLAASAVLSR